MKKNKKRKLILKFWNYKFLVLFFSFLIEFIKPKQDDNITKDLIKTRQLEQSMLRFTRFYEISDGSYQRDESSTEYSCLMTEG
jgi:hypothetical protein